jgi:hypothetical protein
VTIDRHLTILLAQHDRIADTAHWMAFADAVRLPFCALIADGRTGDSATALLVMPPPAASPCAAPSHRIAESARATGMRCCVAT